MTFNEYINHFNELDNHLTNSITRCDVFMKYSLECDRINSEKAELMMIKESVSDDEVVKLYAESMAELTERLKKTAQKIINDFIKFVKKTFESFKSWKDSKSIDKLINEVELRSKHIENFSDITVTYKNYAPVIKKGKEKEARLRKLFIDATRKHKKNVDKEIEDIEKKYDVDDVVVITVSIATAIALAKALVSDTTDMYNNMDDRTHEYEKMENFSWDDPEMITALEALVNVQRQNLKVQNDYLHEVISAIKKAISSGNKKSSDEKKDDKKENNEEVKESTHEYSLDDIMTEIEPLLTCDK